MKFMRHTSFLKHLQWGLGLLLLAGSWQLKAQTAGDTLVVNWAKDGIPDLNALRNTILSDTTTGGKRKSDKRVYKLLRGGYYFLTETLENKSFHLNIVGEKGKPAAFQNPPVLQLLNRTDGSNAGRLLDAQGDVTLKNLILNGRTDLGNQPYETIRFNAPNASITLDNCILEHAEWGILAVYGKNANITVTNSKFRNLISHTQPWGGRGISVWVDVASIYFENNTFLNIGGFPIQVEGGAANYFWFNHNTLVNIGRNAILGAWWREAYVANNLIVNGFWHGEDKDNFTTDRLAQPDLYYAGMFSIEPLPSAYGLDIQRKIALVRNATYRDPIFTSYYASTSGDAFPLRPQPLMNARTKSFFDTWDNMVEEKNTDGTDPAFVKAPPADVLNKAVQFIKDLRSGSSTPTLWYWEPGRTDPKDNITTEWPLPENLAYTNASLKVAANGNLPLGDLNWFPTELKTFQAQQKTLEAELKALIGAGITVKQVGSSEAETMTLAGGAKAKDSVDAFYLELKGAGYIRYTAEVATAGKYDLNIAVQSPFSQKKQRLYVNGTEVKGADGGEAIDYSSTDWGSVTIANVELKAGKNDLEIRPSWGYQNFGGLKVLTAGTQTTVASVAADAATLDGVGMQCLDANGDKLSLCASGNKFVEMTGVSSLVWNYTPTPAGTHALKIHYLLPTAKQQVDIYLNGAVLQTGVVLDGATNAWLKKDVYNLALKNGVNQIELRSTTGSLQIDKLELFKVAKEGTASEKEALPKGFALNQNYPNPFNPTTTIRFTVAAPSNVKILIFDSLGRHINTLLNEAMTAGDYQVVWNGRNTGGQSVPSGVYFYRMEAGQAATTRSMILLK